MPLVRLPGQSLRRHPCIFGARGGLQDMKKVKADRLLNLYGAALRAFFSDVSDPDIAALPKIVQILLLRDEQVLEPVAYYAIHGPFGAPAELFWRSRWRRMVDHVFGEIDWAVGPSLDCERDLAEVFGA